LKQIYAFLLQNSADDWCKYESDKLEQFEDMLKAVMRDMHDGGTLTILNWLKFEEFD